MTQSPISNEVLEQTVEALKVHGSKKQTAAALGITRSALDNRLARAAERGSGARTHYVAGPKFPLDNMGVLGVKIDTRMDVSAVRIYGKSGSKLVAVSDLPPAFAW